MALKVTSPAWSTAGEENRLQRDEARDAFFAQAGVKPAKSLRNIFLDPSARAAQFKKTLKEAQKNRIGESSLDDITSIALEALAFTGLGTPSLVGLLHTQPFGILALSPEVLKAFFVSDHETALEISLIE